MEYYINTKFPEWNISFIGIADNIDSNDIENKKASQITALTNEWYLEYLSNNIKSAIYKVGGQIKRLDKDFGAAHHLF